MILLGFSAMIFDQLWNFKEDFRGKFRRMDRRMRTKMRSL